MCVCVVRDLLLKRREMVKAFVVTGYVVPFWVCHFLARAEP